MFIFDASAIATARRFAGGATLSTVYSWTPSGSAWTEDTLYFVQSSTDGGKPYAALSRHGGQLYGATSSGGRTSGGTAYELMPSSGSWTFDLPYSFTGTAYLPGPLAA